MNTEDGIEIVLTPLQLAAVLEAETIEESATFTNRLWGGVTLVAGALELIGGAALLLVPEPTTITKITGGSLGLHGLDTASTGIMQVVSGRTKTTLTSQAVEATANYLGSDQKLASQIGTAVNIGVPLIAGFAGFESYRNTEGSDKPSDRKGSWGTYNCASCRSYRTTTETPARKPTEDPSSNYV